MYIQRLSKRELFKIRAVRYGALSLVVGSFCYILGAEHATFLMEHEDPITEAPAVVTHFGSLAPDAAVPSSEHTLAPEDRVDWLAAKIAGGLPCDCPHLHCDDCFHIAQQSK